MLQERSRLILLVTYSNDLRRSRGIVGISWICGYETCHLPFILHASLFLLPADSSVSSQNPRESTGNGSYGTNC
uniref:Uncharacterized protein n=1 Tax=Helianthus annuus TaxID=4232 RepID=A0A251U383_HELAN